MNGSPPYQSRCDTLAVPESEKRALVVDDHEEIREAVSLALEMDGFEVRSASDGSAALSVLHGWRPCVIVLDLMMPRMDGWTFRRHQLTSPHARDIPVVVLTAARQTDEQLRELAARSFIAKPFEIDDLLDAVRELC